MTRRPLYALYVADSISLAGNAVAQLAIPWYVLITTGSPALTGLAVFFNFVPAVLAAFFGGVVVDRLGFRTTSVAADLASAAAVAAIPLAVTGYGFLNPAFREMDRGPDDLASIEHPRPGSG